MTPARLVEALKEQGARGTGPRIGPHPSAQKSSSVSDLLYGLYCLTILAMFISLAVDSPIVRGLITLFVFLVILLTSFWVGFDAEDLPVEPKGFFKGMGKGLWFFACIGLWVLSFPLYLYHRNRYADGRSWLRNSNLTGLESVSEPPFTDFRSSIDTALDPLDELEQIADSLDSGLITTEQFTERKQAILNPPPRGEPQAKTADHLNASAEDTAHLTAMHWRPMYTWCTAIAIIAVAVWMIFLTAPRDSQQSVVPQAPALGWAVPPAPALGSSSPSTSRGERLSEPMQPVTTPSSADSLMSTAYFAYRAGLDPEGKRRALAVQRDWLRKRAATCLTPLEVPLATVEATSPAGMCLTQLSLSHVGELLEPTNPISTIAREDLAQMHKIVSTVDSP